MQIPSVPPPIVANTLPQDVAVKAVPVMQAMAALVQNPVIPSSKSEKFSDKGNSKNQDRHNQSKPSEEEGNHGDSDERGNNLNIRI